MNTHAVPRNVAVFHRGTNSQHLKLELLRVKFLEERMGVGAIGFVEAVEVKGGSMLESNLEMTATSMGKHSSNYAST